MVLKLVNVHFMTGQRLLGEADIFRSKVGMLELPPSLSSDPADGGVMIIFTF